jgi:hypothetical protein
MTKPSSQIDKTIASLALAVIDLRAHFEAQLRRVARAEEALVKCRNAQDASAFDTAAATLRGEVQVVSENNRSVRTVLDQMEFDAREFAFPARR